MIDLAGQYIGNYQILRLLGEGGFAHVYLGKHRYLKSVAALKMLLHSLTEQKEQCFLEEAQTLVGLRHAHIVRVLDFAVERGMAVLVMDYIPKGTLRQRHPRGTRLSLDMTVEYVKQVASALQYAHNHHVIHRDVKPENILLDADERLVLSDFGLALFAPSPDLLSTQALAGTLLYISPEQARGKPCFASDQYSLGILTYEWLTGVRPFEGSRWELVQQHLTATPPLLREHCPELPASVEQVVLRALAKDPQERYVSISAFAQALERACRESQQDNDDSQKTAPLLAGPRSSLVVSEGIQTPKTIFLSATPSDEPVAKRLATDLKRRGLLLSNDLSADTDQEEIIREAMRAAQRVVVVVTPRTRSSRVVREHLRLAQVYQRRPVLVWMEGDEMVAMLLDDMWEQLRPIDVIDMREDRYEVALEELLACLREDTYVSFDEEATFSTTPRGEARNPYKGLRAFRQEDAPDFFGRDALLEEILKHLRDLLIPEQRGMVGRQRILTVVGPSGSGKSSVVLAGLLPRLRTGALPSSQSWIYLEPIVPGTRPIEALALTLAPHFPEKSMKILCEDLQDDTGRGLHWLAMQMVKESGRRLVLVIDQFEELFLQVIAEEERRRYIELLVTAVTEASGPVLVILTLRADCLDRPMRYAALARLIEAHRQLVLPMEIHELREVIEGPASLPDVHLTFEGNLAGDLLYEAQGQVGALPLLQFTLDQLFQRREGQTLTVVAYQEIGGVKGALVMQAEATYAALPSQEHHRLTRALFLRLIDPGMNEQDTTRRRASLTELSLPDTKQTAIIQQVAHAFTTARLLTTSEVAGSMMIEVSHEALIREWPRLAAWLHEGREDSSVQQAVSKDVGEWERRGKPKDRLYRGSQLKEAQAWARRNLASQHEVTFLQACADQRLQSILTTFALLLLLVLMPLIFLLTSNFSSKPNFSLSSPNANTSRFPDKASNLDFANGTQSWFLAGDTPQDYDYGIDPTHRLNGQASAYLKASVAQPGGFATLMQDFRGSQYYGKRLRLSGFVTAQGVEQWAGLWMRVDGKGGKILSFDNMGDRPIRGTNDARQYTVALDVPTESAGIYFGILLAGKGQVWLSHVQLEVVGTDVPTTDLTTEPRNLDFASGTTDWWSLSGETPEDYIDGIDPILMMNGKASAYLKAWATQPRGSAILIQTIRASSYLGKRLRLSALIKTQGVEQGAGLWMSIEGKIGHVLKLADVHNRLIQGTTDGKRYEVVLDVPQESVSILFGIQLIGKGLVWLSDVQLEVVGTSVPTTES